MKVNASLADASCILDLNNGRWQPIAIHMHRWQPVVVKGGLQRRGCPISGSSVLFVQQRSSLRSHLHRLQFQTQYGDHNLHTRRPVIVDCLWLSMIYDCFILFQFISWLFSCVRCSQKIGISIHPFFLQDPSNVPRLCDLACDTWSLGPLNSSCTGGLVLWVGVISIAIDFSLKLWQIYIYIYTYTCMYIYVIICIYTLQYIYI